jgi:hypothetical protein
MLFAAFSVHKNIKFISIHLTLDNPSMLAPKAFLVIDNKIYGVANIPMDHNLRRASNIKNHVPL